MLNVRLAALALLMSLMANATAYGQSTPAETRRVALVIGNGSYPQSPVASVPGDARAVADVLREGGFDVVYAENATRTEIEAAIGAFTKKLGWGTTAMVYFGGHAVRYQDRNFLLAIDFEDCHRGRRSRAGDRHRPHPRSADRLASGRLRRHSRCRAKKSLAASNIPPSPRARQPTARYQA